MKLTRVIHSGGQNLDSAFTDSLQPSVSRRGFITAAGMGIVLAAMGRSPVREAKASGVAKDPRNLTQIKTLCGNCAVGCVFIAAVENDT